MDEERQKKSTAVLELVEQFILENRIGSSECVYQCDCVSLNSLNLIDSLCEVAGYFKYPGDEDDE